jgi:NADH-quinone oxidoreductase subunit B
MAVLPDVMGDPIRFVLNWGRRYSLWVFNFGLACCAIEFIATSMGRHDFIRLGVIPFAHGPRQADLMVVSGTVTDKMAPAIKRLYDQMPEPKYVISFGACSNCGGPYWDSYSVTKGVDQLIPVDVYVPGCPPRPEALLHGILRLQQRIAAEHAGFGGVRRVDGQRRAPVAALTAPLVRPEQAKARVVVPDGVVWHRRPREPEAAPVDERGRLPLNEISFDRQGAGSPFGDDVSLPLPPSEINYQPPSAVSPQPSGEVSRQPPSAVSPQPPSPDEGR